MGGHEGNTESIPMRCIFLITLFSTLYGFIILNDNWPKSAVELSSASAAALAKQSQMQILLQALDTYYVNEVDVDEHDHDDAHGAHGHDDHGDHGHEEHGEGHADEHHESYGGHEQQGHVQEETTQRGDITVDDPTAKQLEDLTDSDLEREALLYEEYLREQEQKERLETAPQAA